MSEPERPDDQRSEFGPPPAPDEGATRRDFLRAAGFVVAGAAVSGCATQRVEQALPYATAPEGLVPGRPAWYATTCGGCPAGCGMTAKCLDGRPIKLEGNPAQPLSQGGLCAVGQAAVLGVYDSRRLKRPRVDGAETTWAVVDQRLRGELAAARHHGRQVRILTGSGLGPTDRVALARFIDRYDARHVVWDSLSLAAVREAHKLTHGVALVPGYRFERAEFILSLEADFLGTWLSPVEFTAGWRAGHDLAARPPRMSRHVQLEARMSLTGSKADERLRLLPGEQGLLLSHLAQRLSARAGRPLPAAHLAPAPIAPARLDQLAEELWSHRGRALVVCGAEDVTTQVLVNYLNELLGGYGATIDLQAVSYQREGDDGQVTALLDELRAGQVDLLIVAGCNPAYDLPGGDAVGQAKRLVCLADHLDETASLAQLVCPAAHFLETWTDGEPVNGLLTLTQPTVQGLSEGRTLAECLSAWMGTPRKALDLVRDCWRREVHPRAGGASGKTVSDTVSPTTKTVSDTVSPGGGFESFWTESVRRGFARVAPRPVPARPFDRSAVRLVRSATTPTGGTLALVLHPQVGQLDGRHAENPLLQELPDPITKVTWDNCAALSPAAARRYGIETGDVVRITTPAGSIELPALVQPGQHDQAVAVALGYGRLGTERFAGIGPRWIHARPSVGPSGRVGVNAGPLREGGRTWRNDATLERTGERRPLAQTQTYDRLEVPARLAPESGALRPVVESTTLAAYTADPHAGARSHAEEPQGELWPADHEFPRHHWAMVIDLSACTGCSACVLACNVENNVPVVGRDEVERRRDMHWLRIDRYYSGDEADPDVAHQPMLCHHCDNAPCEVVCPVLATVHSEEGLNQQVYNRCVGTRYCANNCPYKVRRFNWFNYRHDDDQERLALNPDVTVRSRGVMEKCSFCVQRIEAAKIEARRTGRPLADGDVKPACLQSCPAGAIHFGDLNDPESSVSKLLAEPRAYRLLTELNIKPSVSYLRVVRHRDEQESRHG